MGSDAEYKILAAYCRGMGLNLCCQHTQIGDSIGVDTDPKARAAKIVCDVRTLPVRTGSMDYVICHHGLEHIRDAPAYVVHEWLRVLRVGGTLAVIVPDGSVGESALNYASFRGSLTEDGHGHLFTLDTLKTIVAFSGGEVYESRIIQEGTRRAVLVAAVKIDKHNPNFVPFSKATEIFRVVQKGGFWRCSKRLIKRLLGY